MGKLFISSRGLPGFRTEFPFRIERIDPPKMKDQKIVHFPSASLRQFFDQLVGDLHQRPIEST